ERNTHRRARMLIQLVHPLEHRTRSMARDLLKDGSCESALFTAPPGVEKVVEFLVSEAAYTACLPLKHVPAQESSLLRRQWKIEDAGAIIAIECLASETNGFGKHTLGFGVVTSNPLVAPQRTQVLEPQVDLVGDRVEVERCVLLFDSGD